MPTAVAAVANRGRRRLANSSTRSTAELDDVAPMTLIFKSEKPSRPIEAARARLYCIALRRRYLIAKTLNVPVGVSDSEESTCSTRLRPSCFAR